MSHVLVAGIGNIFLGDDAFGSEVARQLLRRPHPPHVRVVDFGIRGLDLVYALTDPDCAAAVLIDAVPRPDEPPGTLFVLEPKLDAPADDAAPPLLQAHNMDPGTVLRAAAAMGGLPGRVLVLGCQPTPFPADDADVPMGLSEPVTAAVDEAVRMVASLVQSLSPNPPQEVMPCHP